MRHPHPTDYARGIARDENKFVLIDGYGHIFTSVSGRNWTLQRVTPLRPLTSIAHGETNFIAVGASGVILSSPDGTNWTALNSPITNDLAKVIFTRGEFVAVGSSGTIISSTNGHDFVLHSSSNTNDLFDIAAGPDALVAVGKSLRGPTTVLVSTNHAEWKQALVNVTNFSSVTHFKGAYHNGWYSSTNPMFWTNQLSNKGFSNVNSVAAISNAILRNVSGRIHSSFDGVTWSAQTHLPVRVYRIHAMNDRFHITGGQTLLFSDQSNRLTVMNLTAYEEDNNTYLRSIAADTNGYIALDSKGRYFFSPDAQSWRIRAISDPAVNTNDHAYASLPFARLTAAGRVETSDDGQQWQPISAPANLRAAAAISNVIVVADWSNIWVKPDGALWTKVATKFGPPNPVPEGGSAEFYPHDPWINSFTAGNGIIVGATGWGELLFSTNGYDWSTNQTPFLSLNDVTFTPDGLLVQSFGLIAEARWDGQRPANNPPQFATTNDAFTLKTPLRYHDIQISPDLTNWTRWRSTSSNITWSVPTESSGFYRAVQPD